MTVDAAPFSYRVAGLDVVSDFALPEALGPGGRQDDRALVITDARRQGLDPPEGDNARSADASTVRLAVPAVGRFVIQDGRHVFVWPDEDVSGGTLAQQITGSVMAIALMQRDVLVLHGAVLGRGGRAVIVLGHTGDGKSTTAAACAARGFEILSDDLAPVDLDVAAITVRAVAPIVRMIETHGVRIAESQRWQAADKTAIRAAIDDRGQGAETASLAAIVQLRVGDRVALQPRTAVAATLALLEHAYCRPVFQRDQQARTLAQCADLATRCAVFDLERPQDLAALDEAVDCIERLLDEE